MYLVGYLIDWVLWIFLLILFARMILSWVPVLVRDWEPRGPMLVFAEIIYSITDPPLRLLRKVLRPVRVGSMMLDLASGRRGPGRAGLSSEPARSGAGRRVSAGQPPAVGSRGRRRPRHPRLLEIGAANTSIRVACRGCCSPGSTGPDGNLKRTGMR